ncbi:MAG: hypothetical protein KGZ96_07650 [Clostridia bacterium]|nr:hypothetical protein [Clostridia bacterium]
MVSLALVLAERKLEIKKVLFVGMALAVIVFGVRLLPLTFGVHTIIFIIALAALLNMATKANLSKCLLFALIAEIALIITEMAVVGVILYFIGLDFDYILSNSFLRIIVGWPQIIIVLLIALGINKRLNKTNSLSELS